VFFSKYECLKIHCISLIVFPLSSSSDQFEEEKLFLVYSQPRLSRVLVWTRLIPFTPPLSLYTPRHSLFLQFSQLHPSLSRSVSLLCSACSQSLSQVWNPQKGRNPLLLVKASLLWEKGAFFYPPILIWGFWVMPYEWDYTSLHNQINL